ncbi:hypothetical protein HC761_02145 [bacterium]|nr:hypothetical protein [bacterium]
MKGLTIRQAQAKQQDRAKKKVAEQQHSNEPAQSANMGAVLAAGAIGVVVGNLMARDDAPIVQPVEPGHVHDCGL